MRHPRAVLLVLLLTFAACQPPVTETSAPAAASASAAASAPAPTASSTVKSEEEKEHGGATKEAPRRFGLPFVRAPDTEDPFDRARNLLREILTDNAAFVKQHDAKYFKPFVDVQKPRATLITCSDSRVQSHALDATPDNDLFTIRNIGNQLATSAGSVEYGVEHLKTPLLVILGHTGCGAVKAAMGDVSSASPAVRRELATLDLSPVTKTEKGEKDPRAVDKRGDKDKPNASEGGWTEGVLNNVHRQVAAALSKFSNEVAGHDLIVVGAVYDFRNDLRKGYGLVHIIDVNGRTDVPELAAFERAVLSASGSSLSSREGPISATTGSSHELGVPSVVFKEVKR